MKGTAVGFMSVCSTVDVELLSSCFDLKPFNGLRKLRGLTPPRGMFMSVNDFGISIGPNKGASAVSKIKKKLVCQSDHFVS